MACTIHLVMSYWLSCLSISSLLQAKNVAHLWELGGGTFLSKLIEVPITTESIRYAVGTHCCAIVALPLAIVTQFVAMPTVFTGLHCNVIFLMRG